MLWGKCIFISLVKWRDFLFVFNDLRHAVSGKFYVKITCMIIFYVILDYLDKNISRTELKKIQSEIGHKIVDFAGKNYYHIDNRETVIKNNKPEFKYSNVQFNISHSCNMVAVGFDDYPIGIDIEYMKERNFKKLGEHYNINTDDKIEFYEKWTQLEAKIKLQYDAEQIYTKIIKKDYMLTIMTANKEKKSPQFIELNINDIKME